MNKIGEDIKNSINNGKGKIFIGIENDKEKEKIKYTPVFSKRRVTRHINANNEMNPLIKREWQLVENAPPGCRHFIVEKVENGVVPLYIILFFFLVIYILIFVFSIIYWIDLRNEKEYDEFN